MDESLTQAYLNLIQSLLDCPSGEEPQILQMNSKLLDAGFLQTCETVAVRLTEQREDDGANFLRNVANQLGEFLGMNEDNRQYVEFIQQLLQAEYESNSDRAVVYPILVQQKHLLNGRFAKILQQEAENLIAQYPEETRNIIGTIENLSIDIQNFSHGNRVNNIEIAITGYQIVLRNQEPGSEQWAKTQNNLGNAYSDRIRGERAENLELAIAFFSSSLEVRTRAAFPQDWARTQNNLGLAYFDRIRGERAKNLELAIAFFSSSLEVRTRAAFPEQWAMTQYNLGTAYLYRIRGKLAENLELAIASYSSSLEVYTRAAFPEQWARTQNNLGIAYGNRIRGERAENLDLAIASYSSSLEVYTRAAFPEQWARAQNNLGIVYGKRIRGEWAENLDLAIASYSSSLEVRTCAAFPQDWAMTQNNLGTAYSDRIKGERAKNLDLAIASFSSSLEVLTRDAFPQYSAMTQNNLGLAYSDRIRGERAENLELAIAFYSSALEICTRAAFPQDWARTQNNLGNAYLYRIRGERAENLELAIASYSSSLEVLTRAAFPQAHAATLFNLGLTYQTDSKFKPAADTYAEAINTVESLRSEIVKGGTADKRKLAEQWNKLYQNMVEVCLELATTEPQYYVQAIEYVERSKARNLVELLANKDIYPKSDIYHNTELYQTHCHQLEQQRRQIPAKQRELEILISNRESEEKNRDQIERLRQELAQLQQQQDELLAEINEIDSSFTFTQKVQPISFSDIQYLIDENTAILEWYITSSQIFTFISTHHHHPQPIVVAFANMTDLENWDKEYRDSYHKQNTQWIKNLADRLQNLAKILHIDEIISSIDKCFSESGAKCNRIILIPHRYLHLFPLHALPLADGKLLFERFPKGVGYAPSCQLLKQVKDQAQNRPDFTRLFAIQNPTRQPARPLLGSQLEIDKIRQQFDLEQTIILKEAEATEANVYQRMEQMRSSHCIHFSCHGKFYPESPLKSALLLADPEGKLGEEANLTLGEVFEKFYLNQCRLVTFSACESGMTDPNSISDEYIGLPSGFLYAGSLSVVSTLWSVDPIATTLLMVKFYHNLQRLPKIKTGDVAISLNKAQKWLRTLTYKKWARIQSYPQFQNLVEEAFENSPKRDRNKFKDSLAGSLSLNRQPLPFANPYYWSAFVAIGI